MAMSHNSQQFEAEVCSSGLSMRSALAADDESLDNARQSETIVSPADVVRKFWHWDVMPKTMRRLA